MQVLIFVQIVLIVLLAGCAQSNRVNSTVAPHKKVTASSKSQQNINTEQFQGAIEAVIVQGKKIAANDTIDIDWYVVSPKQVVSNIELKSKLSVQGGERVSIPSEEMDQVFLEKFKPENTAGGTKLFLYRARIKVGKAQRLKISPLEFEGGFTQRIDPFTNKSVAKNLTPKAFKASSKPVELAVQK